MCIPWKSGHCPSVRGVADKGAAVNTRAAGRAGDERTAARGGGGHRLSPSDPPPLSPDLLGQLVDLPVHASPRLHEPFDLLDAVQGGGVVAFEQLPDLDER